MKSVLLGLALAVAGAQDASGPGSVCAVPVMVPGFERWAKGAGAPQLKIADYADLVLAPVEAVHYTPPLKHMPRPAEKGGLYELTFQKAGLYRFALSADAMVDVVGRGNVQTAIAQMRGPTCSGIVRIVEYRLQPGEYMIEISATSAARLQMLVIGPH